MKHEVYIRGICIAPRWETYLGYWKSGGTDFGDGDVAEDIHGYGYIETAVVRKWVKTS